MTQYALKEWTPSRTRGKLPLAYDTSTPTTRIFAVRADMCFVMEPLTTPNTGLFSPPNDSKTTQEELQSIFDALVSQWKQESEFLSSTTQMAMLPSYQRIIGLGNSALPLLLKEIEREPDYWFWALTAITGEDPIRPEDHGNLTKMAEAWLSLGRRRKFLS